LTEAKIIVSVSSEPSCPAPPTHVRRILSFSGSSFALRNGREWVTNFGREKSNRTPEIDERRMNPRNQIHTLAKTVPITEMSAFRSFVARYWSRTFVTGAIFFREVPDSVLCNFVFLNPMNANCENQTNTPKLYYLYSRFAFFFPISIRIPFS
jgi:hypothetical protein